MKTKIPTSYRTTSGLRRCSNSSNTVVCYLGKRNQRKGRNSCNSQKSMIKN